jgi:hypothetical protein
MTELDQATRAGQPIGVVRGPVGGVRGAVQAEASPAGQGFTNRNAIPVQAHPAGHRDIPLVEILEHGP